MKKIEGHCGICGVYGELTKEHVPPQKAFNDKKYISVPPDVMEGLRYDELPRAKPIQGGISYNSLCQKCNNQTGSWYGREYVEICHGIMMIAQKSNFKPPNLLIKGYPLRFIKQVITMFFSINPNLRETNPELIKFVLNKEAKYLPEKIKVFGFYNFEGTPRYNRIAVGGTNMSVFSEFAYPPLGFVLAYDSPPPDLRMYDLTFLSESDYDIYREIPLKVPTLPTHLSVPGTYLEKNHIEENYKRNGFRSKLD